MQLTFLGTGSAFSQEAYNASILVDRDLLLDAGAPLCVHLPRVGVGLQVPKAALLTHFHADHTFGLASLMLGRALEDENAAPFAVLGPVGTTDYLRQLLEFAWGLDMLELTWKRLQVRVEELKDGDSFEIAGYSGTAFEMTHTSRFSCLGYVVRSQGVRLGYTGDAELSGGLDRLLNACDHVVSEMTYELPGPMHLSRPEVLHLIARHPTVRFILTHLGKDNPIDGAQIARDFLTLQLPLP